MRHRTCRLQVALLFYICCRFHSLSELEYKDKIRLSRSRYTILAVVYKIQGNDVSGKPGAVRDRKSGLIKDHFAVGQNEAGGKDFGPEIGNLFRRKVDDAEDLFAEELLLWYSGR